MFIELGALVTQQGELINNIAYNVDQAGEKVEKGRKQLSDAERHQRSARRKKAICFTILFVLALILLLVVLGELGAFSPSDSEPEPPNTKTTPTDDTITDETSIVIHGGPTPETQTNKEYDKPPLDPLPT